ncbi:neuropeptide CCHamide-2 isoform X2 [Epargyreus clarus]|uniref:neuropeptide CCHamide-2 isoform X2 n=1 Tax=Epargyreus clarus TaxID=520877 RepID=UPI003C2AE53C
MCEAQDIIMAVKKHPCLWDIKNNDYHNRDMKEWAWHQVCKEVVNDYETFTDKTNTCGCSAFGHSCYGGHGKRSGDAPVEELGQEETPPHPVYPHSSYRILASGDDIIPIRDGGVFEREDNPGPRDVVKMKLRNIVKHWMENYRRSQQNNDDGYFIETL